MAGDDEPARAHPRRCKHASTPAPPVRRTDFFSLRVRRGGISKRFGRGGTAVSRSPRSHCSCRRGPRSHGEIHEGRASRRVGARTCVCSRLGGQRHVLYRQDDLGAEPLALRSGRAGGCGRRHVLCLPGVKSSRQSSSDYSGLGTGLAAAATPAHRSLPVWRHT